MAKLSITRRLIVSVILAQVVLTLAVVALATYLTEKQLRDSFDAALHGRVMSVAALVRYSEDNPPKLFFDSSLVPPPLDRKHADLYQILGADGEVIGKSPNWDPDFRTPSSDRRIYWTVPYHQDQYRVVHLNNIPVLDREGPETATPPTLTVIYAASTEEIRERVWAAAIVTCLGSIALLAISTAISVWTVRRGLSPLAALASSAGRVSVNHWKLDAPPQVRETQELVPLTDAMDGMLATLQHAFTSQREFLANAAHELKTPIAVLKSTLQLLLQQPRSAEEYRAHLEGALDDLARLEALTHSMLRLARAEQSQTTKRATDLPLVDLASSCEQSAERLKPVSDSRSVRIDIRPNGPAKIHADPEDLELVWNNLFENAVRYSPAGSAVLVSISRSDQRARVDVEDRGPGIAEIDLQNIFNRFHRADASRSRDTGGYGLGLAIVKAMVEAYGGTISAESSVGRGTKMSVSLPINT